MRSFKYWLLAMISVFTLGGFVTACGGGEGEGEGSENVEQVENEGGGEGEEGEDDE